ncbi:MAG TPA: amidohydrolase family protein [Cyclobacteriaceae bacterium]|jgi:cytosine/adenosine deaminase-related metal-dependent hydrolase|nr:amidohydrolase family protein [Cyclobacteriaceae bacterium]
MDLLLKNLSWHDGFHLLLGDIRIQRHLITEIGSTLQPKKNEQIFDFKNHFLYPGLINSHDHLEMNLYPKLGTPPFNNYVEWANDIYKPAQSPLLEIQKVDIRDRLMWGGLKNLVSGVTTVIHHNPWHSLLGKRKFPVKVLKNFAWAHSLQFEKDILKCYPRKINTPFIIHGAEGKDEFAFSEIAELDRLGLLKSNTVIVHAIAVREGDIELLANSDSSVVWCPASNLFMFEMTAPIQELKNKIKVALGTDSTLTGSSTLLDEIKVAAKTNLADARGIYNMVSSIPVEIFGLPEVNIAPNQIADLFIAPIKANDYFENLQTLDPADMAMVLIQGEIRLLDVKFENKNSMTKNSVTIQGRHKKTDIDIAALKSRIEKKVGSKILNQNPLWVLLEV